MKVQLSEQAKKTLSKLDKSISKKITSYLHEIEKLADPRSRGKGLTADKAGLWRYRVGEYRLICHIQDNLLIITVIRIGHRKAVYDTITSSEKSLT